MHRSNCFSTATIWFLIFALLTQVPGRRELRLVPGPDKGRLQVLNRGIWGSVCDDGFNLVDARVACRHLGYNMSRVRILENLQPVNVSEPIWLDEVRCMGRETTLTSCRHRGWANTDCHHSEDVILHCNQGPTITEIRLEPGGAFGRLDIKVNGSWASVCNNGFNTDIADAACRQLGFPTSNTLYWTSKHTDGSLLSPNFECFRSDMLEDCWYDIKQCQGQRRETHILCSGELPWNISVTLEQTTNDVTSDVELTCKIGEAPADLGVKYTWYVGDTAVQDDLSPKFTLKESNSVTCGVHIGTRVLGQAFMEVVVQKPHPTEIRLVPGPIQGRLEVKVNGDWRTVCQDGFGVHEAAVACRELGFNVSDNKIRTHTVKRGTGLVWLNGVRCLGTEPSLGNCSHGGVLQGDCSTHHRDVGLRCGPLLGDVKLVPGPTFGRLMIFSTGDWRTVCQDRFSYTTATKVCRQLGFDGSSARVMGDKYFKFVRNTGFIWIDEDGCSGQSVRSCRMYRRWSCSRSNYVVLSCAKGSNIDRVTLDRVGTLGRLQVFSNGSWGEVCSDHFFYAEASVTCRQIDHPSSSPFVWSVPPGNYDPLVKFIRCSGTETSLNDCWHVVEKTNCSGRVMVSCWSGVFSVYLDPSLNPIAVPVRQNVRLRCLVTVPDGFPMSVLQYQWRINRVVVKTGREPRITTFTKGLVECLVLHPGGNILGNTSTTITTQSSTFQDVRIIPGPQVGHVEVKRNERWVEVCATGFPRQASRVICRQLGFQNANRLVVNTFHRIDIEVVGFGCNGTELTLAECKPYGNSKACRQRQSAMIACYNNISEVLQVQVMTNSVFNLFQSEVTLLFCESTPRLLQEPTYEWFVNKRKVNGTNTAMYQMYGKDIQTGGRVQVTCEVNYSGSTARSPPANLTVFAPPTPFRIGHKEVFEGDAVRICLPLTCYPKPFLFRWKRAGLTTSFANSSECPFITTTRRSDSGEYIVNVLNRHTSVGQNRSKIGSGVQVVKISVLYPPVVSCSSDCAVPEGAPLKLLCIVRSNPRASNVTWSRDGVSVIKGDNYSIFINSTTHRDSGIYTCTVTNIMRDSSGREKVAEGNCTVRVAIRTREPSSIVPTYTRPQDTTSTLSSMTSSNAFSPASSASSLATAVPDQSGSSTAVSNQNGSSTSVSNQSGSSTAVSNQNGSSTAVSNQNGSSTAVSNQNGFSTEVTLIPKEIVTWSRTGQTSTLYIILAVVGVCVVALRGQIKKFIA